MIGKVYWDRQHGSHTNHLHFILIIKDDTALVCHVTSSLPLNNPSRKAIISVGFHPKIIKESFILLSKVSLIRASVIEKDLQQKNVKEEESINENKVREMIQILKRNSEYLPMEIEEFISTI